MVDRDFYVKMKKVLESEEVRKEFLSRKNIDARRAFITKLFYFLIGTRDFDNIDKYVGRYYKGVYPFDYMEQHSALSKWDREDLIYRNLLRDGFLFHITPQCNVDNILEKGLLTLDDKYGCNVYERCNEINGIYATVRERKYIEDALKMPQIIRIPGNGACDEDRFNTVFLSSNLSYALLIYGENGELSSFFLRDILWAFGIKEDVYGLSLEEIKAYIIYSVRNKGIEIYESELAAIFSFLDMIYEEKVTIEDSKKSIVMVPTKDVVNNSNHFQAFYRGEDPTVWSLELIHDYRDGEVQSEGSISPENIMVVDICDDKGFVLRKKQ